MTEPSRAVFLSYASQDAETANRICEALRAAGIEVWFDQSELRGGDAWDASIRRQIKTCALFIPFISRNTHARDEGYFRLEWKLAVDRSHLMTANRPFLVPVVIDDTSEQDEQVPDRFRDVQWTRLAGGRDAGAFVERVLRLLSPDTAASAATSVGPSVPHTASTGARSIASTRPASRSFAPWVVGGLLILATGYLVIDKFLSSKHAVPAALAPAKVPAPAQVVSEKSIAVLPFLDMSEKKDQEYFSDGLSEELIDLLAKVPGLHVPARTSSFYFKGKAEDIPAIAKRLLVAYVLEGSVRKSGNRVRVTAQLIRADNGYHLWSETYDRKLDDIFKVQDEIAAAVVNALKVSLLGNSEPTTEGTSNAEAYNLFLQGRAIYRNASNLSDCLKAVDYLQRAVKADPSYARAWAYLSSAERLRSGFVPPDQTAGIVEEGRHAVEQSLRLNPNLSEAHSIYAGYFADRQDFVGAEAQVRKALELDPTNQHALAWAGTIAEFRGQFEPAIAFMQKATEIDPVNPHRYTDLARILLESGKPAAALSAERKAKDLNPTLEGYHEFVSQILLAQGNPSAALAENDRDPDETIRMNSSRVKILDALGRKAEADAVLAQLEKAGDENAYNIACIYALRGEVDQAFKWLDRAIKNQPWQLSNVYIDPDLRGIHGDPRFKALLKKSKLFE